MKTIKILQLDIINFKGKTIHSTFDGDNCIISGKNQEGKTMHIKAWQWLLTGYSDTLNGKNFEIFDNTKPLSNDTPMASVKASILINNEEVILERTAKASFSRKKGEEEYTKDSSDKYSTSIDDIEYASTAFNDWIEDNICQIDMLKYLVNGEFFANLSLEDKDKARKVLENIIGEIKLNDFKGNYTYLFENLCGLTIEQLKEQTKKRIKPIKKEIDTLPTIIESKQKEIAELSSIDFNDIEHQIEAKNKEIADIDNELLGNAERIKPLIEKRNQEILAISQAKNKIDSAKQAYNDNASNLPNKIRKEINEIDLENELIKKRNIQAEKELAMKKQQIDSLNAELAAYNDKRNALLLKRDNVKARIFNAEKCQYCGQILPADMIDELQAQFNKEKLTELDNIIAEGKAIRERIDSLEVVIASMNEDIENGAKQTLYISTEDKEKEYEDALADITPFESTDEYQKLIDELEKVSNDITEIPDIDNSELTNKKKELQTELGFLNRKLGTKDTLDRNNKELLELMQKQRTCGMELAKLQRLQMQINNYIEEKANIISSRVNDLLDYCYIEMQSIQKNGEPRPDCVLCRKDKVKYATINGSDRPLMCADLQRMFCKYYQVMLPLFLDEVSVIDDDRLPKYNDMQYIYIERKDNELKIDKI